MLTSSEIRRQFIDYFVKKHGHVFVPSSPVVPHGDPTLMFANAGMNQFKPYFLGTEKPPNPPRVVNTQKCIRAGGKHNDLEDVGKDTYHHTFFEMLGNWSFGDYFKKEAIAWGWDLLTNVWGMDKTRLHATVFEGNEDEEVERDEEAARYWREMTDINPAHIHYGGKKDNFWEMGETGPCGPCSEVHIDLTPDKTGGNLVNAGDARVMEIWNLVFIQFNRDAAGKLTPLPAMHVDTGMGFERLCAVLQGKSSNYDTDVFTPIFQSIHEVTCARPYGGKLEDSIDIAYRVIADHIRTLTFALTDGAVPSNEGRGYVLRRILRRAVRHGWQTMGVHEPFLTRLVPTVVNTMGDVFPELRKNPQKVADLIREEEKSFERTLGRGIEQFETYIDDNVTEATEIHLGDITGRQFEIGHTYREKNKYSFDIRYLDQVDESESERSPKSLEVELNKGELWVLGHQGDHLRKIPPIRLHVQLEDTQILPIRIRGRQAFKLHDTYGFPLDLTQVMADERGLVVDVAGFHRLMDEARERARAGGNSEDVMHELIAIIQRENPPATKFLGYETQQTKGKVLGVHSVAEQTVVITDQTPFYAEAGGQVGDIGVIRTGDGATFKVENTLKIGDVYLHLGKIQQGKLTAGQQVELQIDADRRAKIMANHTTTHVMNRALRKHVNAEADQKGSLVDDQKLRFDFSHHAAVTLEQIEKVEEMVNADISADLPVYFDYAPVEQGRKIHGLRAVFGEKYPPKVRIVSIGVPVQDLVGQPDNAEWANYSVEFCGGTHLAKSGDAEGFAIVTEEAVGKGVRRITALTGAIAHQATARGEMLLSRAQALSAAPEDQLSDHIAELTDELNAQPVPALHRAKIQAAIGDLQKKVKDYEKQRSKEAAGNIVEVARKIADEATGPLIVTVVEGADAETLRTAMDVIRKKRPEAAMLLAANTDGKLSFLAAVPDALIKKGLKAGDWVREVAKTAGGGGGGRPDMAQAGGKDPAKLNEAMEVGRQFAISKI